MQRYRYWIEDINEIIDNCKDCNYLVINNADSTDWNYVCRDCMEELYEGEESPSQVKTIKTEGYNMYKTNNFNPIMNNQAPTEAPKPVKNENLLFVEFSTLSVVKETKDKLVVILNNNQFIWLNKSMCKTNDFKLSFNARLFITGKDGSANTIQTYGFDGSRYVITPESKLILTTQLKDFR